MKITKENLKDIELYLHPKQKGGWIEGNDLYQHLKEKNLLEDCLTLKDLQEIQKLGLEEYNKYFKGKWVYGWNSVRDQLGDLDVPYLYESGDEVVVSWGWLGSYWGSGRPALRFGKPSKLGTSELIDTQPFELPEILIINGIKYKKQ